MKDDIAIIVVNWNTRDLLNNCLGSIASNSGEAKVQTIVVDNASNDGSADMVRTVYPGVRLIDSGANIGFGRANNLAIPVANATFLLFLNPDTLVLENTLGLLLTFMKDNPDFGGIGCKMKSPPGTDIPDAQAHELGFQWFPSPLTEFLNILFVSASTMPLMAKLFPYMRPHESGQVIKLYGGCLMVRKEVLDNVGYFDERFFMYGEDVDLCHRITQAGWKLYYMSEAEIIHVGGAASKKTSSHFPVLMKCDSISKLMEKYYGLTGKVAYRGAIMAGSSIRLAVLFVLKALSMLKTSRRQTDIKSSWSKYVVMLKWGLCIKRALVKD
jgi:GT2 family glycosyltransferase